MSVRVTDNSEASRYEVFDGDELAGFTRYRRFGDVIDFLHTEIDARFAGRGLGGALARGVLGDARERHLKVLPHCPFIRAYIAKHREEHLDLVPEDQRASFGL